MAMLFKRTTLLMSILVCNQAMAQTGVINLTKPADINDAKRVEQALDRVTTKVMQCVRNKLAPPQSCHCLYPKDVANLKGTYTKILQAHPDWSDMAVSYTDAQNKFGHMVSFLGLHRQFEQKCK